jgi:ribonuclease HI
MKDKELVVLVSPSNASSYFSSRLKTYCTNNQAEYEALLFGFGTSKLYGSKKCECIW